MSTDGLSGAPPMEVVRSLLAGDRPGGVFFFDSGPEGETHRAWSIVCAFPKEILIETRDGFRLATSGESVDDPLGWIKQRHRDQDAPCSDVPFNGGLAGVLTFEFAWQIDALNTAHRPTSLPGLWIADYPTAAVFSHAQKTWTIVGDRESPAAELLREAILSPVPQAPALVGKIPTEFYGADPSQWLKVSREAYEQGVQSCIDAIYQGELFEINYTERFEAPWTGQGFELFEALRETSTGSYGGYLETREFSIASISPEQFLEVDKGRVRARPIKGTRRRDADPAQDRTLGEELLASEKDRAENVMIVDLMRNDLTRFCKPGSVKVEELCKLESFAGVHHLVSTIEGALDSEFDGFDALLASFPAGSITGAPKLRSIELIAEFEQGARGAYTGSFFYWSSCGRLDSNVLIRTATLIDGTVSYGAGGAVVADSVPTLEYQEALLKARPLGFALCKKDT